MSQPVAQEVAQGVDARADAQDYCELTYDERFLRRRVLTSAGGVSFLVDLPKTMSLDEGDGFALAGGAVIAVRAAVEPLLEVRGDLVRLAWHIGNRHKPAQIEGDRLLIQRDHVLEDMLHRLGAQVAEVSEPFTPEGGAYGHGRTHGHSH